MIVPLVVLGLAGAAGYVAHRRSKTKAVMTPERRRIYENALQTLKDPVKLKQFAEVFQKEGLTKEADLLRKRAAIRELPEDAKQARRKAFRSAMKSTDKNAILKMAETYDSEGATGAAAALRTYASGLP